MTAVVGKGRENREHSGDCKSLCRVGGRMPEARGKAGGMDNQRSKCTRSCKYDPEFELCPVSHRAF